MFLDVGDGESRVSVKVVSRLFVCLFLDCLLASTCAGAEVN